MITPEKLEEIASHLKQHMDKFSWIGLKIEVRAGMPDDSKIAFWLEESNTLAVSRAMYDCFVDADTIVSVMQTLKIIRIPPVRPIVPDIDLYTKKKELLWLVSGFGFDSCIQTVTDKNSLI